MPEKASSETGRGRTASRSPGRRHKSRSHSQASSSSGGTSRSRSRSRSRGGRSKSPGKKKKKRESKKKKKKKKGRKGKKDVGERPVGEWSREELMDRVRTFSKFETNRNTGSGSLHVANTRILGESLDIVCEVFRRFQEIQYITFRKCFVTDDILEEMLEAMAGLQHVKSISLPFNALTGVGAELLSKEYGMKKRHLEELDLRENQLEEEDGHKLWRVFKFSISKLNGVPVKPILQDLKYTSLDLKVSQLKQTEMAIICGLLRQAMHLAHLNLSANHFDAIAARCLAATIPFAKGLRTVDLSGNPLTNKGKDEEGVLLLADKVVSLKQITGMNIRNCGAPDELCVKVERSASVNRAVFATRSAENNYFVNYVRSRLDISNLSEVPENPWLQYNPPFKTDPEFTRLQKLNEMQVEMRPNEIKLNRKVNGPHGIGMKF